MIAVIRDTTTGDCHLTDFELDIDRLEECGYELAGYLANPKRVTLNIEDNFNELEDDHDTPEFTTCSEDGCKLWLMIDPEWGAPEYCTKHETENE